MPHYRNGREAKIGDIAVGTTYNRQGRQVGVVVGITPNAVSCNCRLATRFNSFKATYDYCGLIPYVPESYDGSQVGFDYTAVSDLLHIEDYLKELEAPKPQPITFAGVIEDEQASGFQESSIGYGEETGNLQG